MKPLRPESESVAGPAVRNARIAGITLLLYYATALSEMRLRDPRVTGVLSLLTTLYALILAVTLYALTRSIDRDLALLAFSCRFLEGTCNAATAALRLIGASVSSGIGAVSGTVFAIGSTLFAYLFLRGRSIPVGIAWLGIIGSAIVIPVYSLRALGIISGGVVWLMSIPLIVFELLLAFWLITRGVRES
jgi:uncharacterized protein DUF4386